MLFASFCFPQEVALRPSQYEAFVHEKDEWISDKFFTQQRLAGVNPMSLMRVTNCCKGNWNIKNKHPLIVGCFQLRFTDKPLNAITLIKGHFEV